MSQGSRSYANILDTEIERYVDKANKVPAATNICPLATGPGIDDTFNTSPDWNLPGLGNQCWNLYGSENKIPLYHVLRNALEFPTGQGRSLVVSNA